MTSYNMTDFFPFITQLVLGTTSHVYRTSSMVALRGVTRTLNLEVWTVSREESRWKADSTSKKCAWVQKIEEGHLTQ